jgi:hypothetical protein
MHLSSWPFAFGTIQKVTRTVMLWLARLQSGCEHVSFDPHVTKAFGRLQAMPEFAAAFSIPVEYGGPFVTNWSGRWMGAQISVVEDVRLVESLDVTALFMASFMSSRIACSAQATHICTMLPDPHKFTYSEAEAVLAIQHTYDQATELLDRHVAGPALKKAKCDAEEALSFPLPTAP